MKLILLLLLAMPVLSFSQSKKQSNKTNDKSLHAYFDYKVFQNPGDSAYIEGYVQFDAIKINYQPVNEHDLQGKLAIQYELTRGDSVFASNTFAFLTPVMKDSVVHDFIELFRLKAAPGIYELKLGLLDMNSKKDFTRSTQVVEVPNLMKGPSLSDVTIAETILPSKDDKSIFYKNGLLVYPRIQNFFDTQAEKMPFYLEAYNIDSTNSYAVKWTLEDAVSKTKQIAYSGARKLASNASNQVVYTALNIRDLPSGEYNLIFELVKNHSEILAKKVYYFAKQTTTTADLVINDDPIVLDPAFQTSITTDSLSYYIGSLYPIIGRAEQKHLRTLLKEKDPEKMRNYMEKFWIAMAKKTTPTQKPYDLWLSYKAQVQLVQKKFGILRMPGYETDRGRVYLQYGSPSSMIQEESSPSEYPYEIWVYDKIQNYSNKRFIFYNPDLANNSYILLHSDMYGEVQNYRWQHDLTRRNSPIRDIDDPNDGNVDHFGGNSSLYYNQY